MDDALTSQQKDALAAAGVRLLRPLGGNAYFATIDAAAVQPAALAQRSVRGIHEIQRNWKLHPKLISNDPPSWSVVKKKADGQTPDRVAVYVLLHSDVILGNARPTLAKRHNMTVRAEAGTINCLVAELPAEKIGALAEDDEVQWIEPPLPPLGPTNDSNRTRTQTETMQAPPYGLNGSGINVLVYDQGEAYAGHTDFGDRVYIRDSAWGVSDHPTHVSGTIGGSGALSGGQYRGMAPGVTIQSYSVGATISDYILYTDPGDIEADYNEAVNTYGSVIANNSIGTNTAARGLPCDWEGNYGATDILIDSMARGSLGAPMRIIWAAGNERSSGRCGTTYRTTAPPANAKNHITVGAVNSNDDSMTTFSSWGPTDDGRIKPDIVGPGNQTDDDGGVTSTGAGGGYYTTRGTSMAAPTVTGLCALLLQE